MNKMKGGIVPIVLQNTTTDLKCSECRSSIPYGGDVITAEKCVSGPRGVVPLGDIQYFCSDECISMYYGNGAVKRDLPNLPPRIP
ncbi:hypothetical protein [Bythopirellula polymerisocia]|uniref:hypothetical protein n=1 Tax=Bythopirellula polymerisocia TaxID=2528003 RepID=UPI0018D34ECA|nr:hypothetical protein [Bythopirellula polymerisocia]